MLIKEKVPALIEKIIKIIKESPDILELAVRDDSSLWCILAEYYYDDKSLSKRMNVFTWWQRNTQCIRTIVENRLNSQNNAPVLATTLEIENHIMIKVKKCEVMKYLSATGDRTCIKNQFIDILLLQDYKIYCDLRFKNTVYVQKQNSRKKASNFLNAILICSVKNLGKKSR
jgi:hypothetical protein